MSFTSTRHLSNLLECTEQTIQKSALKAQANGLETVTIKGETYYFRKKLQGKGYEFSKLPFNEGVSSCLVAFGTPSLNGNLQTLKRFRTEFEECDNALRVALNKLTGDAMRKFTLKVKILIDYLEFKELEIYNFEDFITYTTKKYIEELSALQMHLYPNFFYDIYRKFNEEGVIGLISKAGRKKGDRYKIPEWVPEYCEAKFWSKHGHINAKNIYRLVNKEAYNRGELSPQVYELTLKERGGIISIAQLRRFVRELKSTKQYQRVRNADMFKSSRLPALGDMREKALYANHYWEIDSTKLDAFGVFYGKKSTWSLISISDIKTAMKVTGVVKNSNAQGISELLYKAFHKLGIPEYIVTDNGKDYLSNQVDMVLTGWGITHVRTAPFAGEQKPFVERHFGTLQNSFTELLEGYKGHSVAEFQAIKSQTSTPLRLSGMSPAKQTEFITQIADRLDEWTEFVYSKEMNTALNASPYELYLQDSDKIKRIDDISSIAYSFCKKTIVTVNKKGIKANSRVYNNVDGLLGTWIGDKMQIVIDPLDQSRCFMFDMQGEYIALATDQKVTPETAAKAKALYKQMVKEYDKKAKEVYEKHKHDDDIGDIIAVNKEVFAHHTPIELIGGNGTTKNAAQIEKIEETAARIKEDIEKREILNKETSHEELKRRVAHLNEQREEDEKSKKKIIGYDEMLSGEVDLIALEAIAEETRQQAKEAQTKGYQ